MKYIIYPIGKPSHNKIHVCANEGLSGEVTLNDDENRRWSEVIGHGGKLRVLSFTHPIMGYVYAWGIDFDADMPGWPDTYIASFTVQLKRPGLSPTFVILWTYTVADTLTFRALSYSI